jgi:RHS repeat-associated protein
MKGGYQSRCKVFLGLIFLIIPVNYVSPNVNSDGSFQYSYPLTLPDGTNGLAPKLSIELNTGLPNSLLGMSAQLSGIPAIVRRAQDTALNYHGQDGYYGPEGFINSVISQNGGPANWRSEMESFTEYSSDQINRSAPATCGDGPCWFKLRLKNGTRMEFGTTNNSRIMAGSSVRVFALTRVEDVNGNFYTIEYYNNPDGSGEYYPKSVIYTQGSNISLYRGVYFEYENRNDYSTIYSGGAALQTRWRLARIQIKTNIVNIPVVDWLLGDTVRSYRFGYRYSPQTNRSLLTSIQEFGTDGSSMPPTQIQWQNQFFSVFPSSFAPNPFYGNDYSSLDANGDGLQDIMWFDVVSRNLYIGITQSDGSYTQWSQTIAEPTFSPGEWKSSDINGDNRDDLLYHAQGYLFVMFAQPDGSYQSWNYTNASLFSSKDWRLADVNGDGMIDLVVYEGGSLYVSLGNNTGYFPAWSKVYGGAFSVDPTPTPGPFSSPEQRGTWQIIDLNGDSRADLIVNDISGNLYVALAQQDGTFQFWSKSYSGAISAYFYEPYCSGWRDTCPPSYYRYLNYFDANGDGIPDLFYVDNYEPDGNGETHAGYIALGDGNGGFNFWTQILNPLPSSYRGAFSPDNWTISFRGSVGMFSTHYQDLISGIIQPTGVVTNIEMKPAYQVSNAIRSNLNSCPTAGNQCGRGYSAPRFLVTKLSTLSDRDLDENGSPDKFEISYEYYNGRYSTGYWFQRAFLGFESIKATEVQSGNYKITKYFQSKTSAGSPYDISSYLSNGMKAEQVTNEMPVAYSCNEIGCWLNLDYLNYQASRKLQPGASIKTQYFNGISGLQIRTENLAYDNFGSVTHSKETKTLGSEIQTVHTYIDYINILSGANRFIGLPYHQKTCLNDCSNGDTVLEEKFLYYDQMPLNTVGNTGLLTATEFISGGITSKNSATYDQFGNTQTVTAENGAQTTFYFDSDYHSLLIRADKTSGNKSVSQFSQYDARFGKEIYSRNTDGIEKYSTLDVFGRVIGTETKNGSIALQKTSTDYSHLFSNPHYLEQCGATGGSFDAFGCVRTYQDALGRKYFSSSPNALRNGYSGIKTIYDNQSREIKISDPYPSAIDGTAGSPLGFTTKAYANGQLTRITSSDGKYQDQLMSVVGDNVLQSMTTDNGKVKKNYLNATGKTAKIEEGDIYNVATIEYSFNSQNLLSKIVTSGGNTIIEYYPGTNRRKAVVDADAGRTEYTYYLNPGQPEFGKIATQSRPDANAERGSGIIQTTTYEYADLWGRATRIKYADGSQTDFVYDETDKTNSNGRLTKRIHKTSGYNIVETFAYDILGNMTTQTRRISHDTQQLCADEDSLPCYSVTGSTMDDLGRISEMLYPDGSKTSVTYQGNLNLISALNHAGTNYAQYSGYNKFAKPETVDFGNGLSSTFRFDQTTGQLLGFQHGNDNVVLVDLDYAYNANKTISSIVDRLVADQEADVSFAFDGFDRLVQMNRGNGVLSPYTQWEFDNSGRVIRSGNLGFSNFILQYDGLRPIRRYYSQKGESPTNNIFYAWSAAGNLKTKTPDSGNIWSYEYDARNMMRKATEQNTAEATFLYDADGQRFLKIYRHQGLPAIKTWTFGKGMELREKWSDDLSNKYGAQATKYVFLPNGPKIASLTGDQVLSSAMTSQRHYAEAKTYSKGSALGIARSLTSVFYGFINEPDFKRNTHIFAALLIAIIIVCFVFSGESHAEKSPAVRYSFSFRMLSLTVGCIFASVMINCSGPNSPTMNQGQPSSDPANPGGSVSIGSYSAAWDDIYSGLPVGTVYYVQDHLGGTSLVTDSSGNEIMRLVFDAYGQINLDQSGKYNPETQLVEPAPDAAAFLILALRYTGQEFDPETGFYYYNARYLDPSLGIFTTPDTIVPDSQDSQGFNRYMYARGNPIKYIDPTGHNWWDDFTDWVGDHWKQIVAVVVAVTVTVVTAGLMAPEAATLAAMSTSEIVGSSIGIGMTAGMAGGLVGGVGMAMANGETNFVRIFDAGMIGMFGGGFGGIAGGFVSPLSQLVTGSGILFTIAREGIKVAGVGANAFTSAITSQQLHCQSGSGSCSAMGENALMSALISAGAYLAQKFLSPYRYILKSNEQRAAANIEGNIDPRNAPCNAQACFWIDGAPSVGPAGVDKSIIGKILYFIPTLDSISNLHDDILDHIYAGTDKANLSGLQQFWNFPTIPVAAGYTVLDLSYQIAQYNYYANKPWDDINR